ncbi:hypothetical protein [Hyphomicrobium sp.]|uniref:hypothetical protein n=1 Tax=Hyphomicrobium sp. TaxID=82 RepID=UPI001D1B3127|nr:hypothetical protein [Hyphomicrobium sp.]MBY0561152.1 hypothetical protein [Hyphomicrobium sp.]
MQQKFVYHPLNRTNQPRAHAASAKLVVSEYLAYVAMLSIAVVIAIITFAYAANITVRWLHAVAGPNYFATTTQPVARSGGTITAPTKFAMLPATETAAVKN